MKFQYTFRHMQWSDDLVSYVEERFRKVKKYETKPLNVSVTFIAKRHQRYVEMRLSGRSISFKASAESSNFFESIDRVTNKLSKQLAKKKAKVQNHKCFEKSNYGKLRRLNPQLEMEPEDNFYRKAG